jgi:general secretion pathway protein A
MYENYYGFKEKPFQIVPNPEYLYLSDNHRNALTYLEYGLTENVGFILLSGEIGSGKTTLIQYILNKLGPDTEAAVIFNTNVSPDQILGLILIELELSPKKDKTENLDLLSQFLIAKYAKGRRVLLIIDEAQNLTVETLEEVRMLSNLQTEDEPLLQIMLAGQPELIAKLQTPNLRQLAQRIAVNYHLTGLDREETGNYISFRLERAGGRRDFFTSDALDMIYRMSGGIPRSINLLCQAALVYGFADEAQMIDEAIIEQITRDKIGIGLEQNAEAASPAPDLDHETQDRDGIIERLRALEEKTRNLEGQIQSQLLRSAFGADNFKDQLISDLVQLLTEERKRNDELLQQSSDIELKHGNPKQFEE